MKRNMRLAAVRASRASVAHIEKLVFVAALGVLSVFVVDSATRDRLGFTPDDMVAMTRDARSRTQAARPKPPAVFPYDDVVKHSRRPLSEAAYALPTLIDPPLWPHRKRGTPVALPPQELLASPGHGLFAMAPLDGDVKYTNNGRLGQRWVVLTGAIPYAAQREVFLDALGLASLRLPATDRPSYAYMRVERAQIEPGTTPNRWKWQRLNVREMYDRQAYWHGVGEEVVANQYLPTPSGGLSLAFPLGPRLDETWGAEVSHPRFLTETDYGHLPWRMTTTAGMSWSQYQSVSGRQVTQYGGNQVVVPEPDNSVNLQSDYLLLRFFDYTVEPGEHYCYRVKLLLANPNLGVSAYHVEEQGMRAVRFLESTWSEPSRIVTVPADDQVLLVGAKRRGTQARLMLTHLAAEDGEIAFKEVNACRGQLLNFAGSSLWRAERPRTATNDRVSDQPLSTESAKPPDYLDFTTGLLVLDVGGGHRLLGTERLSEPASILLVDARGNLIVRHELDDSTACRRLQWLATPIGDSGAIAAKPPASRNKVN